MTRPRPPRVLLVQAPVFEWSTPSNGIALMCAHLKNAGFSPLVYDASIALKKKLVRALGTDFNLHMEMVDAVKAHPELARPFVDEAVERILSFSPDVVGFSVLTATEEWSLELAARVKERRPECLIVFGGAQCLREVLALDFIKHPAVDAVMLGEADRSMPRFLREWHPRDNPLPRIPGVLVKRGAEIVDGGDPDEVEDLDALPFLDFSGFDLADYSREKVYLSSSRGCVRKCTFCTHIVHQKVFRTMSARRTVEEIKHHLKDRPDGTLIEFNDSLINGNVRRVGEIADLLIEYRKERLITHPGSDFGWSGMAILHPTMTPQLLRKMRWGGCRRLHYGLESGSQRIVDLMGKNFRLSDAEKIIADTKAAGIGAHLFLLVGFPGETEKDFQMTLDFVERNAPNLFGASVSFCEIQKASHLDRHAADYGVRVPIEDPTRWVSADGTNTHELRLERTRRAMELITRLRLNTCVHTSKIGDFTRVPVRA